MLKELTKFSRTCSVAGREDKLTKMIEEMISPYADEIKRDAQGNLIALKKSNTENAKKLVFYAHIDTCGFYVTNIEENGSLRIGQVGNPKMKGFIDSEVIGENELYGILRLDSDADTEKYAATDFFVDIGEENKSGAEAKISVGDSISPIIQPKRLGKSIYGFALERINAILLIEAFKELECSSADIYAVFSAQSTLNARGAKVAAYGIPADYSIILKADETDRVCTLIKDADTVYSAELNERIHSISEFKIKPCVSSERGEGGMIIASSNSPVSAIALPVKDKASRISSIKLSDIKKMKALISAICRHI